MAGHSFCFARQPERSLAKLARHSIDELTALVKTRLKRMQYRPGLIYGFITKTRLDFSLP
ncbi:hypothetical protein [Streptomyces sp. C10]|uniref:hypothetical protein n=1 Tax=Streptomyces sp. C10 TaxID=531941 RepID=UPI00397FF3A5